MTDWKSYSAKKEKPTFYFINSMSDTFHEHAQDSDIDKIMDIVEKASWHKLLFSNEKECQNARLFQ